MSAYEYEYESVDHDASIRAERGPDPDHVTVIISFGTGEVSIEMWGEEFDAMVKGVRA